MVFPQFFMQATESYTTFENPVPAPYLRRSFTCPKACTAQLAVSACGFYEVYVNGRRYTKGFLAPYISNPDHILYADRYEVPLDAGENVIALWLGNGFQNNPGGYIWDFDRAPFRSAPRAAVVLEYPGENGETVTLKSDTGFKTAPSPVLFDDYRFGEVYDANRECPGWNDKGFDDTLWQPVIQVNHAPDVQGGTIFGSDFEGLSHRAELRWCEAEPIVAAEELQPVSVTPEGDGYIYDFGRCDAGVCRLTVQGRPGQRIELQHADMLKDDGTLALENVWFLREYWERDKEIVHKDVYICKGEGTETYTPTFTYHGFRYVKVTGITPEQAVPQLLTYVVMHSDLPTRGDFSCSDETANRLQTMTRRSDLSNFYYFPTDCPQREKNGWTADAALSTEQVLMNFCAENSYREWLRNICKAQDDRGALPGIVPTGGWGFLWGNGPAWDSVLTYLPYYVYQYTGKTEMIRESAAAFMRYLQYLTTRTDEDGLIHIGLGDWCPVGRDEPKAPLALTDSVISMDIAHKMAHMLDAIGMTAQAAFARSVETHFKTAVRKHLIDFGTMTAAGNCQTSQAMCIYYGVFTPEESRAAFACLLRMIHAADDHMDVGVLGGRVLFRVLSKFGCTDLAYKMITRPDYPSYGNWIARGATTLWENFWPDRVSSANHHFWGDISAWFMQFIAGIRFNPHADDVLKVEFTPGFIPALTHAEAYFDAPAGRIAAAWKREGEEIRLTLTVPETMHAVLKLENGFTLADGTAYSAIKSGEYRIHTVK